MTKYEVAEHKHCLECKMVLEKEYAPDCGLLQVAGQLNLSIPRGVCYACGTVSLENAIREKIRADRASADARAKAAYRRGLMDGYEREPIRGMFLVTRCPVCREALSWSGRCPECNRKFKR